MRLALALLLWAVASAAVGDPRVNYMLHCMGCHLMDGSGMPPDVPRLSGRVGYYLVSAEGRSYLIQVPGASQSLLNDAELAEVLNWIVVELGGESAPGEFEPYTEAEVRQHRRAPAGDIGARARRLAGELPL